LAVVPGINVLANLILCETVPLLNLAFELVPTAIYNAKIVISELSPLLLDLAFDLLPISFDSIPVHVNLRRSAYDMIGSEHMGSTMVPLASPGRRLVKFSYRGLAAIEKAAEQFKVPATKLMATRRR
jgi:hypothetical protein